VVSVIITIFVCVIINSVHGVLDGEYLTSKEK